MKIYLVLGMILCYLHVLQANADSSCNKPCQPGTYLVKQPSNVNCSTICVKCPPNTITNTTNLTKCTSCPDGKAANPSRTNCHKYDVISYALSRVGGVIAILLMVFSAILIIATIILFTCKRQHELVISSNYHGIVFFLIGCLLVLFSPVPLLTKPLVSSCSIYIALFNIGLTMMLAVLISRSAYVNQFFNEEGVVVKSDCGSSPRGTTIAIVFLIQVIFLIIGLAVMKPETVELKTQKWDIYYEDCSHWASLVFWVGFGYNVILSLVGNFLSCSSTQMRNNCEELKHLIMSYLAFYVFALLEIVILFRASNEALAEGQAILCFLYTCGFFGTYIAPKVYIILFHTKEDGTTIKPERLLQREHEDHHHPATLIHAKDGYKTHVVGLKIKS